MSKVVPISSKVAPPPPKNRKKDAVVVDIAAADEQKSETKKQAKSETKINIEAKIAATPDPAAAKDGAAAPAKAPAPEEEDEDEEEQAVKVERDVPESKKPEREPAKVEVVVQKPDAETEAKQQPGAPAAAAAVAGAATVTARVDEGEDEQKEPGGKPALVSGPSSRSVSGESVPTKKVAPAPAPAPARPAQRPPPGTNTAKVAPEGAVASEAGPSQGAISRGPSSRTAGANTAKVTPMVAVSADTTAGSGGSGGGVTSSSMPNVLKATEVHAGSVFHNERQGVGGELEDAYKAQADDEAYIPISFAKAKIETLAQKLMAMREEHHAVLAEMSAKYEQRQEVAKKHYTDFVKRIQAAAVHKVQSTQALLDAADAKAEKARAELMAAHAKEVQAMQARLATDSRDLIEQQQGDYKRQIEEATAAASATAEDRAQLEARLAEVTASLSSLKDQYEKASVEIGSSRALFEKRVITLQVQSDKDREQLKAMNATLKRQRQTTAALLAQAAVTIEALEQSGGGGTVTVVPAASTAPAAAAAGAVKGDADPAELAAVRAQLTEAHTRAADLEAQAKALQEEAATLRERLKIHDDADAEASASAAAAADGSEPSADAKQLVVVRKEMALLETKLEESRAELAALGHQLHASEADSQAKTDALEAELATLRAEQQGAGSVAVSVVSGVDVERLEKEIATRDAELAASRAEVARLSEASKAAVDSAGEVATLRDQLAASQAATAALEARLKARAEASAAEGGDGAVAMVPASELDLLSKSLDDARAELATAKAALVADRAAAEKDVLALKEKIAELEAAQAAAAAAGGAVGSASASASGGGGDDGEEVRRLRTQVETLEASGTKQQAEVAHLEARLAALEAVKADGEKLAAELAAKEQELGEFRAKIAELEASVGAAMAAQESGGKVDSAALAEQVAALKADVNSKSEALAATSGGAAAAALEAKNAELEAQLDKLKADFTALEREKAAMAAAAPATPKKGPPPAPPPRKGGAGHHSPDPAVLSKATQEYTDRIDQLEQEKAALEQRIAALEAATAAAGGDSDAAAATLKLAEENTAKGAEIEALQGQVSALEEERDMLLKKVASLQAAGEAGASESAEAQVARPVAATLVGVRTDAATALTGKKYSAAKSTLTAGVKRALEELEAGGAAAAHASLKKAYGSALKKKGASGVAGALDKAIVNFVVEFGDAALLNVAAAAGSGSGGGAGGGGGGAELKKKLDAATADLKAAQAELKKAESTKASAVKAAEKAFADEKSKLLKDQKATAVKVRQLEAALEKAEKSSAGAAAAKAAAEEAAKLEKKMVGLEKKHKAELDAIAATNAAAVGKLELQAKKAEAALAHCQEDLAEMTAEMKKQKKVAASIGSIQEEMEGLRAKAEELEATKKTMKEQTKKMGELETLYKKESVLRKRYWNMMEDMKGKIRVYCRCRPFAQYEIDRKCQSVVSFPDDVTIKIKQDREDKEFIYDQCFSGTSSQEEVFEDCRRLVQSAMDGYNVCVFAYGQTGSGKTWTMVGKPEIEGCGGLTPRSIDELFMLATENKQAETKVRCYMIEIYNDQLVDLLYVMTMKEQGKKVKDPPRLDIKKDSKGMVVIQGAVVLECPTAERTMEIFDAGNKVRHVGSTKMNAESSRSHLIFAVLVEVYDKQTKKTANGKFSFIDLAGSERAGKTGATADRLKEAMSINKSLSALGNVISALSTNEKFIPYRDNKLTLVMSDSLGGNAKTLMFVNVSPADYNAEETLTSLVYASRVKLITNDAKQEKDSAEISRLKKIIHNLKKGLPEDGGVEGDAAAEEGGGAK